jgi:hypothetical protein
MEIGWKLVPIVCYVMLLVLHTEDEMLEMLLNGYNARYCNEMRCMIPVVR